MSIRVSTQMSVSRSTSMDINVSIQRYRCGGSGTAGDEKEVEGPCEYNSVDDDVESEGLVEDATSVAACGILAMPTTRV